MLEEPLHRLFLFLPNFVRTCFLKLKANEDSFECASAVPLAARVPRS